METIEWKKVQCWRCGKLMRVDKEEFRKALCHDCEYDIKMRIMQLSNNEEVQD